MSGVFTFENERFFERHGAFAGECNLDRLDLSVARDIGKIGVEIGRTVHVDIASGDEGVVERDIFVLQRNDVIHAVGSVSGGGEHRHAADRTVRVTILQMGDQRIHVGVERAVHLAELARVHSAALRGPWRRSGRYLRSGGDGLPLDFGWLHLADRLGLVLACQAVEKAFDRARTAARSALAFRAALVLAFALRLVGRTAARTGLGAATAIRTAVRLVGFRIGCVCCREGDDGRGGNEGHRREERRGEDGLESRHGGEPYVGAV